MNKLNLKGKILFVLFVVFLIVSDILFSVEQMILAVISLIIAIVFAVLLIYHKNGFK